MTMWVPSLKPSSKPKYVAIADALAEDIRSGQLLDGARLPTHRALSHKLGVTAGTVTRAYREAERRGLVAGEVGRGSFVRLAPKQRTNDGRARGWASRSPRPGGAPGDYLAILHSSVPHRFELSVNFPVAGRTAPPLAAALRQMADDAAALDAIAGYVSSAGMKSHREAASLWLRRLGVEADAEEIVLTAGCQNGIFCSFLALSRPGDVLLAEQLTWPGLRESADALGLDVRVLAMDENGIRPDDFERACLEHAPRLLYTMPTLHNPTALIMPLERRREIAGIAERHGVFIVEDDVYGFLAEGAPPPLRTFAPARGVYVNSLSKVGPPGLRVGFVWAPSSVVPLLKGAVRTNMLMASPVAAEVARRLIVDGAIEEMAAWRRDEARDRQRLLGDALAGLSVRTHPVSYHAWVRVPPPLTADAFVARLLALGVAVTPGEVFGVEPAAAAGHVRICLGAVERREDLRQALRLVAEVARAGAAAPPPVV